MFILVMVVFWLCHERTNPILFLYTWLAEYWIDILWAVLKDAILVII